MQRALPIVERELRKFIRTPALLVMTLLMPVMNLVVLGNAFGGRVRHLNVAVVDEDGGPAARRVREAMLLAADERRHACGPIAYDNETRRRARRARRRRSGRGDPAAGILATRLLRASDRAPDCCSTTPTTSSAARCKACSSGAVQQAARERAGAASTIKAVTLDPVELFPFVPYMRYMLPGVITLGMFMTVMIGGGMSYLDDKQRGVHEGYLVTPITKLELVLGQNLAGTIKAIVSGVMVTILGALVAGVFDIFQPVRFLALVLLVIVVSFAFMAMMSCLVGADEQPDAAARDVRRS